MKSILDPSFPYVSSAATDVATTWQRFGFSARANAERRARRQLDELGQLSDLDSVRSAWAHTDNPVGRAQQDEDRSARNLFVAM